jgi:hypothetical protein
MRTDISAPTKLRLRARNCQCSNADPEIPTSAFGALATTVPSGARTTMSRNRNEGLPSSSRSSWVPPTETVCEPPKFSSIADLSHGVAKSNSIGPLASRHHNPRKLATSSAAVIVAPQKSLRRIGRRRNRTTPRRKPPQRRRAAPECAACFDAPPPGGPESCAWCGRYVSCPIGRPSCGLARVECRRLSAKAAHKAIRGTACAHPTQVAMASLTGGKRRKEGIWRAN